MYWHSNHVNNLRGLSKSQRLVLLYLCGKASSSGIWSTPYETIAAEAGVSVRSAIGAVKQLENLGYLYVVRRRKDYDKSEVNKYIVFPGLGTPPRQSRLHKPLPSDRGANSAPLETKISLKLTRHSPPQGVSESESGEEKTTQIQKVAQATALDKISNLLSTDLARLLAFFHSNGTTEFDILAVHNNKPERPVIYSLKGATASDIAKAAITIRNYSKVGCMYIRPKRHSDHSVVLLDDLGIDSRHQLLTSKQCVLIETSKSNYQAWIAVDKKLDETQRKAIQIKLCKAYGADKRSVSGEHYGRMPGFSNKKPKRNSFLCRVDSTGSGKPLLKESFFRPKTTETLPMITPASQAKSTKPIDAVTRHPQKDRVVDESDSGKEFGWAFNALKAGMSEVKIRRELFAQCHERRGKDAQRYIDRTMLMIKERLASSGVTNV